MSMKGYKANLGIVSGRYGEMERRLLDALALEPLATHIKLPGGIDFLLMYLLRDGLIAKANTQVGVFLDGKPLTEDYAVTPAGREFIGQWVRAEPVETDLQPDTDASDP